MSANCPYDDDWCLYKQQELVAFQKRVRKLAENKESQVFFQLSDDKCPVNPTACNRYKRYLNIVAKVKAAEKQNNGR